MKANTILKVVGIGIGLLLLLLVIGIGVVLELHVFRASVSGRVTDSNGMPVQNTTIEFTVPDIDSIEYDCKTTTNSDGRYFISLPEFRVALDSSPSNRRYLSIGADGYIPFSKSMRLKKGKNYGTDFELTKAMAIRGRAVDTEGKPVANKTLSFYPIGKIDGEGMKIGSSGSKTNEKGYFDLNNVGAFNYNVTLYADENKKTYKQKLSNCEFVNLEDFGDTKELEITFNDPYDHSVEGVVVDVNGNPTPNTYISTWDRYGHRWSAYTDNKGEFCIIGLDGLKKEEFELHVRSAKKKVKLNSKNIKLIIP